MRGVGSKLGKEEYIFQELPPGKKWGRICHLVPVQCWSKFLLRVPSLQLVTEPKLGSTHPCAIKPIY